MFFEDSELMFFLLRLLFSALVTVATAAIPIIIKFLVAWLQANTNEKTMVVLSELVQVAVESVEDKFVSGEGHLKRDAVIDMVSVTAKLMGLKVTDEALGKLVDMLLEAAVLRTFNPPMLKLPDGFE